MEPRTDPDPELLFAHASWLEALARRMARDPHEAEDLVQEAWLAWLKRPGSAVRSTQAWMAGVLAKSSAQGRRGAGRRREHEARAVREGVERSAEETVMRASLGRELLDAVLALDEPFRSAVLLRYYEDLAPPEIARRLDVKVRTVHSRLARGLERLRQSWKRAHGEDELGALALVAGWPLSRLVPASGLPPTAVGVGWTGAIGLMNTKLMAGVVLGVACIGGVWSWRSVAERAPVEALGPRAEAQVPELEQPPVVASPGVSRPTSERAMVPDGQRASVPAEALAIATLSRVIRGRVLDTAGVGLAGVEVGVRSSDGSRATSAAGGWFELEAPAGAVRIAATDPKLATVLTGVVPATSEVEPLVVVSWHRPLGGTVVDEQGLPLQGARVRLAPPPDFASRFDGILDGSDTGEWLTGTDADGRFALEEAPVFGGGLVEVNLDGFEPASVPEPMGASGALSITLLRPRLEGLLNGRVVDAQRLPAPGCQVSLGGRSAVTDLRGEFRLDPANATDSFELTAARPGSLPGRLRADADPLTGEPVWPDFIELALGPEPLTLSGVVVDPNGEPLTGLHVWLQDPTFFGEVGVDTHAQVEYLLAMSDEDYGDGDLDGANWASTQTDAQGRFSLRGLLERDYRLHVMSERSLIRREAGPFSAGAEDVRVVFDAGPTHTLRGRVVRADGAPVANVQAVVLGKAYGGIHLTTDSIASDADGRFEVAGLGAGALGIRLRGDDIAPHWLELPDGVPEEELELVVAVRCHFKVDLGGRDDFATALRVLDADGARMPVYRIGATGVTTSTEVAIIKGRSLNLGVIEDAHTLVLLKDGEEVARSPLRLTPGRLEVVRP